MKNLAEFKLYLQERKEKGRMFNDYTVPLEESAEQKYKKHILEAQQCMSLGMTYDEVFRIYHVSQEELLMEIKL